MGVNGPPPRFRFKQQELQLIDVSNRTTGELITTLAEWQKRNRNNQVHKVVFPLYNLSMKDEVNRKILLDLFTSPMTLIPVVGGLTCLILAFGIGSTVLAAGGFMAALVGAGIFTTKLVFGLNKITEKAYQEVMSERTQAQETNLDNLDSNLRQDKDPRPEQCLRELRAMKKIVGESARNTLIANIKDEFDRMFEICVKQIAQTDELWRASKELNGKAKQSIKDEREKIVIEIQQATQQLAESMQQIKSVGSKQNDAELADARKEFEQRIAVAKKVDERLANLTNKDYDIKEFE